MITSDDVFPDQTSATHDADDHEDTEATRVTFERRKEEPVAEW